MTNLTPVERMAALGQRGHLISVACGPTVTQASVMWSVYILFSDGVEIPKPFVVRDFTQAIDVAEMECANHEQRSRSGNFHTPGGR